MKNGLENRNFNQPSIFGGWFFYCLKSGDKEVNNKILKKYSEVCNIFLKQNKRKESGDEEINDRRS